MEDDALEGLDLQLSDDESKNPSHNKLLGAVSQLYEKKRVKAPTRKEPSLEVSEFHLSKADKKHDRIKVTDLAKVLNRRAAHAEIGYKLKSAQKSAKTIPKPLEQTHADRINRVAGYENAKQQLNRWDAIVYQQRVAEQLTFPLKNETVKVHENTDVAKLFRKPTELELQMAEILKSGNSSQKEEEKKEEDDYPLTLAEIVEKRKMMAKLRAQQSYKQAKAIRHSKIKSKKFHQIQRRSKVKEQLKEFEELQKKDPEAALKKLEELERTRAEERVTLRHRSTGQWAKNLAVRAKYDKEARIALSEQLSKSRELTVKLAQNRDSESEKEEEEVEVPTQQPAAEEDPDNPWVVKRSKEMEDFVSGYRKYWEKEGKDLAKNKNSNTAVEKASSAVDLSTSPQKLNNVEENNSEAQPLTKPAESLTKTVKVNEATLVKKKKSKNERKAKERSSKGISQKKEQTSPSTTPAPAAITLTPKSATSEFRVSDSAVLQTNQTEKKTAGYIEKKNNLSVNNFQIEELKLMHSNKKANQSLPSSSWVVSDVKKQETKIRSKLEKGKAGKNNIQKSNSFGSSFEVTNSKTVKNTILKPLDTKGDSGYKVVPSSKAEEVSNNEKSLDRLFEEVEDKIQNRIQDKVNKLKNSLNNKRKNDNQESFDLEAEDNIPSLELKKQKISADVDEELIENTGNEGSESREKDPLFKYTNVSSNETKESNDIDPNKFLKVTPRILSAQLPEMMTEGDDAVDDEEKTAENRHLTISEAFAEDDVVDQFQKEKEEEVKKDSVGDVDLTLPGWGSWGGHNMKTISRRKRKKFVIKFPKAIPRRDTNRGNIIINEDADKPIKDLQVSDVPFPFTSVKEYEASIRAPLGSTWLPQTAHRKLTMPSLVTKLGTIIAPMDESQLVKKPTTTLPTSKKKKKSPVVKKNKK